MCVSARRKCRFPSRIAQTFFHASRIWNYHISGILSRGFIVSSSETSIQFSISPFPLPANALRRELKCNYYFKLYLIIKYKTIKCSALSSRRFWGKIRTFSTQHRLELYQISLISQAMDSHALCCAMITCIFRFAI